MSKLTQEQLDILKPYADILEKYFPYHNESFGFFVDSTIYITACLDSRDTWSQGYLENSRYGKFSIEPNGNIRLFSGPQVAKFRQCKFIDLKNFEKNISEWKEKSLLEYPVSKYAK